MIGGYGVFVPATLQYLLDYTDLRSSPNVWPEVNLAGFGINLSSEIGACFGKCYLPTLRTLHFLSF